MKGNERNTFNIFGVPVYKTQSYFVYVPLYKTEYAVLGMEKIIKVLILYKVKNLLYFFEFTITFNLLSGSAISPNPKDSNTMLVTIDRIRHQATTIRPCFPELVYKERRRKSVSGNETGQNPIPVTSTSLREPIKSVFGVPVNPDNTYHIYIPDLKKEVVDFGKNIFINPDDEDTVIVAQVGIELIGSCVRPTFLTNNVKYGDEDISAASGKLNPNQKLEEDQQDNKEGAGEPACRYKLLVYGVPVNDNTMYEVSVSSNDTSEDTDNGKTSDSTEKHVGGKKTHTVSGRDIHYSSSSEATVEIEGISYVVEGVRNHGDDTICTKGGKYNYAIM